MTPSRPEYTKRPSEKKWMLLFLIEKSPEKTFFIKKKPLRNRYR
jgi:hypothetical protein